MTPLIERRKPPEHEISPIRKILIANRGEIAVRAIKACEKRGIPAVLMHADQESERNSYATRLVDKNASKGWELAPVEGYSGLETYGDPTSVLEEAIAHECDAIFLGYGYLAENADFVEKVEAYNTQRKTAGDRPIKILGPDSTSMRLLGDKANAREFVSKIKVGRGKSRRTIQVVEGSETGRTSLEKLLEDIDGDGREKAGTGYPVMLKGSVGGGGAKNVVCENRSEVDAAYDDLGGEGTIIAERYIRNAIHVEMQIVADQHGNVVCLGERDCTMQRKSQKLVEESPSPHITDKLRKKITEEAIAIAKKANYAGPATIEYIFDKDRVDADGDMWHAFMEANTRIQVEHVVTEMQTGIDIVDTMMDIAEGRRLQFTQDDVKPQGHTMEIRIYAEDPQRDFEQSAGVLSVLKIPEGMEGVRIDKGYEEGDEVSDEYDGTIFKINIHGVTRQDMLDKGKEALTLCEIAGVKNNLAFQAENISTPEFIAGEITTTFVQERMARKRKEARDQIMNELLGENGTFTPFPPSRLRGEFPLNPVFKSTHSDSPISLEEYMAKQREKTGLERASEYGIVERDGVRYVAYLLDPKFNAGTFGKEEGWMFTDACRLANQENLPLITVTSTAGARNHEGSHALDMMANAASDLSLYPPLFHIDIRYGYVFGAPIASYASLGDLFFAVNDDHARFGLTGPNSLAAGEQLNPVDVDNKPSSKAADVYRAIDEAQEDEGPPTHTPMRHHQERTGADMLPISMTEAGAKTSHLLQILKYTHPQIESDLSTHVFSPTEQIGYGRMPHPVTVFSSGEQHPGFIPKNLSKIWDRFPHRKRTKEQPVFYPELSVSEKRRIITHLDRPTGLDLIDTRAELFDDAVLLDHVSYADGIHQPLPISFALVRLEDNVCLVGTQNPQERKNETTGEIERWYKPIRPSDWEAAVRFFNFAEKAVDVLILNGNTSGADGSRSAEDAGQEIKLARALQRVQELEIPVFIDHGDYGGSGGVLPFSWYGDYAVMSENALRMVADIPAQRSFIEGVPILNEAAATEEEIAALDAFAEQFKKDITAQGHLATGRIDEITPEGPGGAHLNPRLYIQNKKIVYKKVLPMLRKRKRDGTLMEERRRRKEKTALIGSVPNPDFARQVDELKERLGI